MSYSKTPAARVHVFAQVHRDIHENKKQNYLVIRDLANQAISYTEARHIVRVAASEPDPKKAFEIFLQSDTPSTIHRPDHPTGCLALYLAGNFIVTIILLAVLIVAPKDPANGVEIPPFLIFSTFIVGIVTLIGTIGIWNYQKWGVFTLIGLACLNLMLEFAVGATFFGIVSPIFRMFLLYALVGPIWEKFR